MTTLSLIRPALTRPAPRRSRLLPAIAMLGVATAVLSSPAFVAAQTAAQDSNVILLSVGSSRTITLPSSMSDVVVVDPNVADVFVRSQNQLYILAKGSGETAVTAVSSSGRTLWSGMVRVGNNLTNVDQMLKLAMPDANITVSKMNGLFLLTGTVKSPEDAAEAERLVTAFVDGPGKKNTVVSRLRTATPLQVNLQVKFAEVSRNLIHEVGTNISGLGGGTGSFSGYVGRSSRDFVTTGVTASGGRSYTFTQPTDGRTTLGFVARMFGMDVAGALDLAETNGLASTLAQPNLTSLSGETASFLAGGEYPYTVSNGTQGNSIQFKQYGVQLAFTPTVLADGRISLRVRPTVSSLDFSINSEVPALKSRSAETTVELGSGQAFMIAGLLNNGTSNVIDKVPGLGDIPILGSLFKSRKFQRDETELVIVVTPYLVKPMNAADARLPTDGYRNATTLQALALQKATDGKSGEAGQPYLPYAAPSDPAGNNSAPSGPSVAERNRNRKSQKTKGSGSAQADVGPGFTF
ncbi:MAG: type II and III secretion system protein family protein [Sphingobium sp.]|nr:type II and III secretion system protein family protein [Sphingobium sp.]